MARQARGRELLEMAQRLLSEAKDANEIRILQAVVFPLAHGMSIKETAQAIGRCARWTTDARNKFIRAKGMPEKSPTKMRSRAYMTESEEAAFLRPFIEIARHGGVLVVSVIHEALEARLGHKIAKASTYNLLHRHNWRKQTPGKRHVSAGPKVQKEWGKNCQAGSNESKNIERDKAK